MNIIKGIRFPDTDIPFVGLKRTYEAELRDTITRIQNQGAALLGAYMRGNGHELRRILNNLDIDLIQAMAALESLRAIAAREREQQLNREGP